MFVIYRYTTHQKKSKIFLIFFLKSIDKMLKIIYNVFNIKKKKRKRKGGEKVMKRKTKRKIKEAIKTHLLILLLNSVIIGLWLIASLLSSIF